ncbi:hypothetical protein PAECIP111891_04567 [Paenibacillus allorhizoplanae]|uniref:N-acetyltransferase domain-containing protein n=1 Tax=Paenibacillus allorhizoplanae TaxID=2905648 RepID=A0ABM9CMW8_9BACL|nr:GNAT family N-acetyltransferase [Paenibacillus allorhizoplanae]CAH1217452.1 hypothetical protein PAECIP111891_04567 [Paenibacillus allorhizoplanae]
MNEFTITKVKHLESDKLMRLVEESTSEGFKHIKRLVTDFDEGINKFDLDGEALYIAILNGEIVGVCGLNQDPYSRMKNVGRVRRLYVSPSVRRFGVGRMLVQSVIAEARNYYQILVLKTDNSVADLLYRSLGFIARTDSERDTHFLQL